MKQFNLTGEPWIPVLRQDGHRSEVSLLEVFERGGEIADLAVPPAERIVLMRLLLCIVMRSLPELPDSYPDWKAVTPELIAGHAAAYLRKWRDAFDLYGEHAFLQSGGLEKQNNSTQDKLDFSLSSGNNHTLFDHGANKDGREHSDAWLARKLLVSQSFSPGGLICENKWNGASIPKSGGASPLMEGSPLHVFCLGQSILESLRLNLIPLKELGTIERGTPVWEDPPGSPAAAQKFDATLYGRLVPLSRAIKLSGDPLRVTFAEACRYSKLPDFIDPYLENHKGKDGSLFYLGIHSDRHPWRELQSLLTLAGPASGAVPPKNLLVRKYLPQDSILRLWCGGVAADQAKFTFTGEWTLALPVWKISQDFFMNDLFAFTKNAELVEGVLKDHIFKFWTALSGIRKSEQKVTAGRDNAKADALREYWNRLNRAVPRFLSEETEDMDFAPLYELLKAIAVDSFRENLPSTSPWHLMACGKIMPVFRAELNKIINPYLSQGEN